MTMEERKVKLEQLRARMRSSARENRQTLVEESAKAKLTVRDAARLERQKKLAEILRTQAEAEAQGEDVERLKNWEWTIEDNENWEKKLARKARRADYEFHDDAHAARRRYKKDLDLLKPDLEAYNRQKEQALGLVAGTLSKSGSSTPSGGSSALVSFDITGSQMVPTTEQRMAVDNFYRDANTLLYADNKPSEDAIDRVIGKINREQVDFCLCLISTHPAPYSIDKKAKFSRKRLNEDEGDITYINERNRVFNKKIARYYDKYTAEIRASFERGTAL
ncbi:SYF2 splicing factor-domain-containing protein [Boletus edulis BED1]|uniref:Pre-mRNA-splicing factor SYF2 n=1 Tax=Boletus edulis BED1 TaxID=1328754 RepID=A0AAD4GME8_BOLED|nr:SYF2 splicing factor-domain-containing protein [Boletus edulis BED1]